MKLLKSEKNIYTIVLVMAVAVFSLLNIFTAGLSERFHLRLDTTENDLYRLSDTTEKLCGGLVGETNIYVVADESEYPVMFQEILNNYKKLSDRLTITYIDPYTAPEFMESWQQKGAALEENDILVTGINGFKQLSYTDLLVYTGDNITGIQAEQRISSAISYVNNADRSRVVFITGHNERPSEALIAVFTDANIAVDTDSAENLAGTSLAVIASPTRDYTKEEIQAISAFLDEGGKLLLFTEVGCSQLENLCNFAKSWNIELTDDLVMDEKYCIGGNALNILPVYTTHEINSFFEKNQYAMVVPSCCALNEGTDANDANVLPLLISSPVSTCKSGETGSFKLALISEKSVLNGDAMVLAVGSRYIYGDDVMRSSSYANREFFAECVKYLLGADTALSIAPKNLDAQPLVISAAQTKMCTVLYLIVLPLACFVAGTVMFFKRRKL